MSVIELFNAVTEKGKYRICYLEDGWTQELSCEVGSPMEAMMITQNALGSITNVTYVERC